MTAIVATIAPPGAGKSTWCARRFHPQQILNLDTLRGQVSDDPGNMGGTADAVAVQRQLLTARCRRGLLSVVDDTNLRGDVRDRLRTHGILHGMLLVAVLFDVPLPVCLARNAARERKVPEPVVARMYEQFAALLPAPDRGLPGWDFTVRVTAEGGSTFVGRLPDECVLPHRDAGWLR